MGAVAKSARSMGAFMALAAIMGGSMAPGSSWNDESKATPAEKQRSFEECKQRYEALLRRKGVKSFYFSELDIYIMARDKKNADRKFKNLLKKRFPNATAG